MDKLNNEDILIIRTLIKAKLVLAKACEEVTTKFLKALCDKYGCEIVGLENKFKSEQSSFEKVMRNISLENDDNSPLPKNYQHYVYNIKDFLRYTIVINHDNFVKDLKNIVFELINQSYSVVKVKNRFNNSTYKDVISWWDETSQINFTFEIQFHTPQSYKAKEPSHSIYEVIRKFEQEASKIDVAVIGKLNEALEVIYSNVPIPQDIDDIDKLFD